MELIATQTLLERKVGITKVRGQAFYLKDFVLFPLLHPAAALHQGSMLEPLKEDFKKTKRIPRPPLPTSLNRIRHPDRSNPQYRAAAAGTDGPLQLK
jgi:hypothetical protein